MKASILAAMIAMAFPTVAASKTEVIGFEHNGNRLMGLLDTPDVGEARSLLILVHGHGPTNVVEQNWYSTLRQRMIAIGISTFVWDKPGCGKSQGQYDHQRLVQDAAEEVCAALEHLRTLGVSGSDAIGFWGASRAGWIVPLVIDSEPDTRFWISESGTSAQENFGYLLRENLRIEGRAEAEIERLYAEWLACGRVTQSGGSYEELQRAGKNLFADPFMKEFFPGQSEEEFLGYQRQLLASNPTFDEETGVLIHVEGLDEILEQIECPVLAIFGERDRNVDWKETKALYERTIGSRRPSSLSIKTFPEGNHNIATCKTGGFRETMATLQTSRKCDGYYEAMIEWLLEIEAGAKGRLDR